MKRLERSQSPLLSSSSDINKAVSILKSGGVVIFPTDTVYGIGCPFDNQKAVDRIYQIKDTPKGQPFPTLVSSIKQIEQLAVINPRAIELMKKYWPGALTIVLAQRTASISPRLSTYFKPGLNAEKVGFRMPDSDLVRTLIDKIGVPIIGTSANFHTHPTPRSLEGLDPEFVKLADFVVKGKCKLGVESTVVDATVSPLKILRQGTVKLYH